MLKVYLAPAIVLSACVVIICADWLVLGRVIFADSAPDFTNYFLQRTTFAFVFATGAALLVLVDDPIQVPSSSAVQDISACACIMFIAISAIILSVDPAKFSSLAIEDGLFEWLSVAALAVAACLILAVIPSLRRSGRSTPLLQLLLVLMAVVFTAIAMEELSWMQRILNFATPPWLIERNLQFEFNFHNLATDPAENVFYLGAFTSLVFFPFLFGAAPVLQQYSVLRSIAPGTGTMSVGVLTTTFSHEMWNVSWIQITFFFSLAAIAATAVSLWRNGERRSALVAAVATAILPAIHVMNFVVGPKLLRYWDDTELKELVVAMGLFLLAVDIFVRAREGSVKPVEVNPPHGML